MRRPPPLPVQPDEQADQQEEPSASSARRGRTPERSDEQSSERATEGAAGGTAGDAPVEDTQPQLSQRDVWRAARARRKALKSEIRRFTQASRRRRAIWLSVLGALVLLIGGSVLAAYSPLFAVEKITVVGASKLDAATVEAALSDQLGTPLALVDGSDVKAALIEFPLIETYTLEAKPPHELTVRIVERTPVGVISSDAGYTLVDAAGVALSTTDNRPKGQPLLDVDGGTGSAAFESAGLVVRSLPTDLRKQLTEVRASSPDDVTLTLGDRTVVWGSSEESATKALTLAGLIKADPDAQTFDVSAPGVGVVG